MHLEKASHEHVDGSQTNQLRRGPQAAAKLAAMLRQSLSAALCGTIFSLTSAFAEPAQPSSRSQRWFVQVWFDGRFPIEIDPANYPGRIEITMGGQFVACALAPVYRAGPDELFLVPLSLGTMAVGRKEDIKVETYGELQRLALPVIKITEEGGQKTAEAGP